MDKKLQKHGVDFNTIDLDKSNDGDLYVFAEAPYPWEISSWLKVLATNNKNILLSLESPIVNPFNHLSLVKRLFRRIYTWDDNRIDNTKYFKFYITQTSFGLNTKPIDFNKKKFLTFINAKKDVPWVFSAISPYKQNLYKERNKSLEYFSKEIPGNFEYYGRGWNELPSCYKGEVEDKVKTLSNYKFCLCFENAVAKGYITEKIFDCFKARCVPIYWGAPNVADYIGKECFIDFRYYADYKNLLKYLEDMTEETYNKHINAIDKFMEKKSTKDLWFKDNFTDVVLKNLV